MMVRLELPKGSGEIWLCYEGCIEQKFPLKSGEPISVEVREGRFLQLHLERKK